MGIFILFVIILLFISFPLMAILLTNLENKRRKKQYRYNIELLWDYLESVHGDKLKLIRSYQRHLCDQFQSAIKFHLHRSNLFSITRYFVTTVFALSFAMMINQFASLGSVSNALQLLFSSTFCLMLLQPKLLASSKLTAAYLKLFVFLVVTIFSMTWVLSILNVPFVAIQLIALSTGAIFSYRAVNTFRAASEGGT